MDFIWTVDRLTAAYCQGLFTPRDLAKEIVRRADRQVGLNLWIRPPSLPDMEPHLRRLERLKPEESPLWGIPFAVKDNIDLAGQTTTAGCPGYAYVPQENAPAVERLLAAGAIPVGKTNLDQFATGLTGTRSPYGEVSNALNPELISGGSSAGSAVAVKLGLAAFALGTDTGGSGRIPAHLNALSCFKPRPGVWSLRGVVPACRSLDCLCVLAHTPEDCAAIDRIVRYPDPEWPYAVAGERQPDRVPDVLYFPWDDQISFFGDFSDSYQRAWTDARTKLSQFAPRFDSLDIAPFLSASEMLFGGPWLAERWAELGEFILAHPDAVWPLTRKVLEVGRSLSAAEAFAGWHKVRELRWKVGRLLEKGVLAMPTTGGTFSRSQIADNPIDTSLQLGRYTSHGNLLGLAALTLPLAWAEEKVPLGITFYALPDQEELLFGLSRRLWNRWGASHLESGDKGCLR